MVQGDEGPAAGEADVGAGGLPGEVEEQLRSLRDEMRRLQEQVRALASGQKHANALVSTHVAGLDAALGGGIPRGHIVVLAGPTGAMKTSLSLHMLVRNRAAGLRGVYVTVEEGRESIVETMRRLGLGDSEDFVVDIGRLRLEHAGAEDLRDWIQVLRDFLVRRRERDPIGFVVIDSLNALTDLARLSHPRGDLFHFIEFLRSLGLTTLLVLETDGVEPADAGVEKIADGVLELRFSGAGAGRVELLLRCAKMRHANHSRDYFILSYADKTFAVRPYASEARRWGRRA